jgi:hypothetical protein
MKKGSIYTRKKQLDPLSPEGVTKGVTPHQKKKKHDPLKKSNKKDPLLTPS